MVSKLDFTAGLAAPDANQVQALTPNQVEVHTPWWRTQWWCKPYWRECCSRNADAHVIFRLLQTLLAVVIAALYVIDIIYKAKAELPFKGVNELEMEEYALAIAVCSAIMAPVAFYVEGGGWWWEYVFGLLWTISFGYFATIYPLQYLGANFEKVYYLSDKTGLNRDAQFNTAIWPVSDPAHIDRIIMTHATCTIVNATESGQVQNQCEFSSFAMSQGHVLQMQIATLLDLVMMVLWLASASIGAAVYWCRRRAQKC